MANPDTLAELTDIAMDLARLLQRKITEAAQADTACGTPGQPTQAAALMVRLLDLYMKVARCIRQIVALRATLGAAALTPGQTAAIERKKQHLRALAAEAIATAEPAQTPDVDPPETERPARTELQDIAERLTDPAIDEPTAIATVARLIRAVGQALPAPTPQTTQETTQAAEPAPTPAPTPHLTELATRIAALAPEPPPPANPPPPHPAPVPDG